MLTISGKTADERVQQGTNFYTRERMSGDFRRVMSVPPSLTENDIRATFENGVLEVSFPKVKIYIKIYIKIFIFCLFFFTLLIFIFYYFSYNN